MGKVWENSGYRWQWAKTAQCVSSPALHSQPLWACAESQERRLLSIDIPVGKSQCTGVTGVLKYSYSERKQPSFECALEGLEQPCYRALGTCGTS